MFDEDDLPKPKIASFTPRGLDSLSVGELNDYTADLKIEIARVEVEILKKQKHKDAMDALFKA